MKKKISEKDKKDWQDFISNKEKLLDKETKINIKKKIIKKIDIHGFYLKDANKAIEEFQRKILSIKPTNQNTLSLILNYINPHDTNLITNIYY